MKSKGARAKFWTVVAKWRWSVIGGVILIALAVVVAAYTVWTSGERPLTQREQALFQVVIFIVGIFGTFLVGRESARNTARDVIRPSARSAFRRVLLLYKGLGRLRDSVDERREFLDSVSNAEEGTVTLPYVYSQLSVLSAQIAEQIGTADNALDDWRDLVPAEVEAIERQAAAREKIAIGEATKE